MEGQKRELVRAFCPGEFVQSGAPEGRGVQSREQYWWIGGPVQYPYLVPLCRYRTPVPLYPPTRYRRYHHPLVHGSTRWVHAAGPRARRCSPGWFCLVGSHQRTWFYLSGHYGVVDKRDQTGLFL